MKKILRALAWFLRLFIPKGIYCYTIGGGVCPFWGISHNHEHQENGICSFMGWGDWQMEATSLLWDQCKECGIKRDWANGEE